MVATGMSAGMALSLLAVACIYWSWRQRGRALIALAGWMLALLSLAAWSWALGPEFGVTYAIIAFVCFTWLAVFLGTESRVSENRGVPRPYQALSWPSLPALSKHSVLFLLSVPLAGAASLMISVAAVIYLPWTLLNKIAVVILLYPLAWGALSAWIAAQDRTARPVAVILGMFLISGILLLS